MNYSGQIINIQMPNDLAIGHIIADSRTEAPDVIYAYKCGHRDARHVAAEMMVAVDARIAELTDILRRIIASADECDVSGEGAGVPLAAIDYRLIEEAKEFLK